MSPAESELRARIAPAYDEWLPLGSEAVLGRLWGSWGVLARLHPDGRTTLPDPQPGGVGIRVLVAGTLSTAAAARFVRTAGAGDDHVVVTGEACAAAVRILESHGVVVSSVGDAAPDALVQLDDVAQACRFAHLLPTHVRGGFAPAPLVVPGPDVWRDPVRALRTLTADDLVVLCGGRVSSVAAGIARLAGSGVCVLAHQPLLGTRLDPDDVPVLVRCLRLARRRGLPVLWIDPAELGDPDAEEFAELWAELLAAGTAARTAIAVTGATTDLPAHLAHTLPGCPRLELRDTAEGLRTWLGLLRPAHDTTRETTP